MTNGSGSVTARYIWNAANARIALRNETDISIHA
jgi:hypothetical protein